MYVTFMIIIIMLYSEFVENICGSGGILGVAYFPISLNGNISFVNSAGPALRVSDYSGTC